MDNDTGNNIDISIIVPMYNAYPYCIHLMESIFNNQPAETLEKIEVIVVDDGSTDESLESVEMFANTHSNLTVIHQENSGSPSRPRNRALTLAQGRYVFFADADDWFYPDAITGMLDYIKFNDIDIGLFEVDAAEWDEFYGDLYEKSQKNCTFYNSKIGNSFGSYKLFKRSLIIDNHFLFPEGCYHEDQTFCLECFLKADRIDVIAGNPYYRYTKRGDNNQISVATSASAMKKLFNGLIAFFEKAIELSTPEKLPMVFARCVRYAFKDRIPYYLIVGNDETSYNMLKEVMRKTYCMNVRALLPFSLLAQYDAFVNCESSVYKKVSEVVMKGGDFSFDKEDNRIIYTLGRGNGKELIRFELPEDCGYGRPKLEEPEIKNCYITRIDTTTDSFVLAGKESFLRNLNGNDELKDSMIVLERKNTRISQRVKVKQFSETAAYDDVKKYAYSWECSIPISEMAALTDTARTQIMISLETKIGDTAISHYIGDNRKAGTFSKWIQRAWIYNDSIWSPTQTQTEKIAVNHIPLKMVIATKMLADYSEINDEIIIQGDMGFDNFEDTKLFLVIDHERAQKLIKWGSRGNRSIIAAFPVSKLNKGVHVIQIEAVISDKSILYTNIQPNISTDDEIGKDKKPGMSTREDGLAIQVY